MRRSIASVAVAAALLGAAVADPAAAHAGPAGTMGPEAAAAGSATTTLAVGDAAEFAVHNGVFYGWGSNFDGQLGDGTTTDRPTPVPVAGGAIPAGVSIVQLAAAFGHVLAVGSDGKAYAWGNNFIGELGDGTTTNSSTPVAVAAGAIPAGAKIVEAATSDDTWALANNGKVYAWGGDGQGQLGDGTTTDALTPVAVAQGEVPAGVKIVDMATSGDTDDVIMLGNNGKLYMFGSENFNGQLGVADTSYRAPTAVAVAQGAIPAGVKITQVCAEYYAFEALGNNGKVYGWGEDEAGELGNGESVDSLLKPVAAVPGAVPAGVKLTHIACLSQSVVALGSNGKLYGWGENGQGELGNGSDVNELAPVAVKQGVIPAGVTPTVLAGSDETAAVRGSDGNVYTWGGNFSGMLGDKTTVDHRTLPVRVGFSVIDSRTTLTVTGTRRFGQTISLTARVIPADTAGTVRFTSGSTTLGSVKITAGSGTAARVATLRTSRLAVGRHTLTAAFTPSSAAKYTSSRASVTMTVAKGVLRAGTPRVTGLVRVGRVLTALPGAWTAGAKLGYQWLANLRPIPGAHFKTLHLTKALRGKKVRVRVTGSKPNYVTVAKASNPTVAVKPA